ncbi:MAG: glucose-1-phosphate thymidylyltransferase [Flavobacteriales bacterium]|jgi:glucose-1-phosphate thymidylyltransferase|nr:glucose-1-phosphate thymidylyltransferase [Flavobacteriales bacterium]|tara:strand:+ start:368 stop:1228 length:861 start_codon:yes stop_codon:yes gene_type:complete
MKGILLAGGAGTRLYPITIPVSKQIIPVYDKPMIYYPLSTLIASGINEILIITTPHDLALFQSLLSDGSQWGCSISYAIQSEPKGIAEAFLIAESFIASDNVVLILGDNIFYFPSLEFVVANSIKNKGASIFAYHVSNPSRYGVVEISSANKILSIEEKPLEPKSNYAIPGFYFFDNNVVEYAKQLTPSRRGELEITDIISKYYELDLLNVIKMDKGTAWLDTGTVSSLMEAGQFVQVLEKRQGLKVGCVEEQAFIKKYINRDQLRQLAKAFNNNYGKYLISLLND